MAAPEPTVGRTSGLLSEGLRVRHIASSTLMTCGSTDNTDEVLSRSSLADFDQIPIIDANRIVGILERKGRSPRALDDSLLVSADEQLAEFIFTLKHQPYRLVVDGTSIRGIVTWSDLLKRPVLLFAYSLISELELLMNAAIDVKFGESDKWVKELDKD